MDLVAESAPAPIWAPFLPTSFFLIYPLRTCGPRTAVLSGMTAAGSWANCVGRRLAALDKLAIADDTVVSFTSDHGEWLGEHLRYGQGYPAYASDLAASRHELGRKLLSAERPLPRALPY